MKTVDKAMKLLNLFSVSQPEIGLSELARMAEFDKAATRRFLVALQNHQFIEQNPDTKAYRLGIGFIHLAKVREATIPLEKIIQPSLQRLMQRTSETAHATLMTNGNLSTIDISFPSRGNRAHLELGEILPLHATASGIVFLSFSDSPTETLSENLSAYTSETPTDPEALKRLITETRRRGYSIADNLYCDEVTGMSVPYFGPDGNPMGTIAVATPTPRFTDKAHEAIKLALFAECKLITRALGGQIPKAYQIFTQQIQEQAA